MLKCLVVQKQSKFWERFIGINEGPPFTLLRAELYRLVNGKKPDIGFRPMEA
jgi:hypothetical protein